MLGWGGGGWIGRVRSRYWVVAGGDSLAENAMDYGEEN